MVVVGWRMERRPSW
uniref:Uncharacterized protein n=1 Tax=Arundo donax TaxID=35708 RepID=A0A0A9C4J2_ARUDO